MNAKQPLCHRSQGSAVICTGGDMSGAQLAWSPRGRSPAATPGTAAVRPPLKEGGSLSQTVNDIPGRMHLCLRQVIGSQTLLP